jgi:ceramide glucosyltransferase
MTPEILLSNIFSVVGMSFWVSACALALLGALLTERKLSGKSPPSLDSAVSNLRLQPISILKPVKGREEGLEENFESFFRLDYPKYELLFSIADADDPARPVIEKLISKYPRVRARLLIGEIRVGPNPKVNNLMKSYGEARHDWILISDSNVIANEDYLRVVVESFDEDVGVVTALVAGRKARGVGGALEAVFLNTFYARWMILAQWFGTPVVVGKSMLFRRSEAKRFGGISTLSRYLAEDYMAGQAMRLLGRRIEVMREPISQPLGNYSFKSFWSRHLRWGRIRKSQAGLAFFFEPMLSLMCSGLVGAWAFSRYSGFSAAGFFAFHVLFWFLCDAMMMKQMGEKVTLRATTAWLLRETLHLPLWLHIAFGSSVNWRGTKLTLTRGGMLKT